MKQAETDADTLMKHHWQLWRQKSVLAVVETMTLLLTQTGQAANMTDEYDYYFTPQ